MKKLWWKFLDHFWPRYNIGYDPAYKSDYGVAVVVKKCRDGTMRVIAWSETKESHA